MEFSNPFSVVTPTLDGPVLRVFARARRPLTTAQVVGLSQGGSAAGIRKVLARLVAQGILEEDRVGHVLTYEANREHLAWPAVELLANLANTLEQRIADEVESWSVRPVSVALFGSTVSEHSGTDSDIDVLVVRPDEEHADEWETQVDQLSRHVRQWTGNDADILVVTAGELSELRSQDAEVLAGDRVTIYGQNIDDVSAPSSRRKASRS